MFCNPIFVKKSDQMHWQVTTLLLATVALLFLFVFIAEICNDIVEDPNAD